MEVLNNPLRAWRLKNGIKAVELAAKMGVSERSILAWETGAFSPNKTRAHILSTLMKIDIDTFYLAWKSWKISLQLSL